MRLPVPDAVAPVPGDSGLVYEEATVNGLVDNDSVAPVPRDRGVCDERGPSRLEQVDSISGGELHAEPVHYRWDSFDVHCRGHVLV